MQRSAFETEIANSLTQFYSVDFSQSRIGGTESAFSTNASRLACVSAAPDGVLVSVY